MIVEGRSLFSLRSKEFWGIGNRRGAMLYGAAVEVVVEAGKSGADRDCRR